MNELLFCSFMKFFFKVEHKITMEMFFFSDKLQSQGLMRETKGLRMLKLSLDTQDAQLNHKVLKHENFSEDPLRWTQDVNSYHFPLKNSMFLFPIVCCLFLPVAHLLFRAVKKVLQANKLDITLYVERRFPLVVFRSFSKCGHL